MASLVRQKPRPSEEPVEEFSRSEGTEVESSQPSRTNSKKRKNHRGGAGQQVKKVKHAFDHDHRRRCDECREALSCWSCTKCGRTLPNGTWADLRLGAEDEDDSIFGRLRFLANLLIFSREEEALFYRKVQGLVRFFAETGILLKIEDPTRNMATGPHPQMIWEPPTPDWTWGRELLFAEKEDNSFMGTLRRLLELGHIPLGIVNDWAWLARSLAKTWSELIKSQGGVDFRAVVGSPCPDEDELVDFNDQEDREAMFHVLREAAKEGVTGEDAASTLNYSDSSSQGLSEVRLVLANRRAAQKHGRRQSKVLAEGLATKEDLAELVRARNEQLEAEEAAKAQSKKERQAQKAQTKGKKSSVTEGQSNSPKRAPERRRRRGSMHRIEYNQDENQTPVLDESLSGDLIPVTEADKASSSTRMPNPEKGSNEATEDDLLTKENVEESNKIHDSVGPVVQLPIVSNAISQQTMDHAPAVPHEVFESRESGYPVPLSPRGNLDGPCHAPSNEYPDSTVGLGTIDHTSESITTRIQQLTALNFLADSDHHVIYETLYELDEQMKEAIEKYPSWIEKGTFSSTAKSWKWSDLQLSAEDQPGSKLDTSKKLVLIGLRSEAQDQTVRNIALRLTKLWLIADSVEDTSSAQGRRPDSRRVTFAEGVQIKEFSPAPGSESSRSDNSDKGVPENQESHELESEEEVIIFRPRNRRH